jgi:protein TonB
VARRRGHQGTVFLEVLVDRSGGVRDLRVLKSSGYATLDDAALSSVKNWLFEPGMRGDQPVEMWVKLPVRFQLK